VLGTLRQKGRAAVAIFLQKFNELLCRLLGVDDNVLHSSAERNLDCLLIALVDRNEIRDHAENTAHAVPDAHDALHALSEALVALRKVL